MEKKEREPQNFSPAELHLIRRLRQHPKLMEPIQRILDPPHSTEDPLVKADEIEEPLLEEMRRQGTTRRQKGPP